MPSQRFLPTPRASAWLTALALGGPFCSHFLRAELLAVAELGTLLDDARGDLQNVTEDAITSAVGEVLVRLALSRRRLAHT
jgi:hypothetical protein